MKSSFSAALIATAAVGTILVAPVAANAAPNAAAASPKSSEVGVLLPDNGITPKKVTFPEGGTWDYGTNDGTYSNYFHKTRQHATSVINGNATYKTSGSARPNTWSKVSVFHTWTGNQAFYRFV
jgi:lactococcin 972 family bacteriocin